MKLLVCILVTLFVKANSGDDGWIVVGSQLFSAFPCKNVSDIVAHYEDGKSPTEENSYVVRIEKEIPKYSVIYLKFDAEASVTLTENTYARIEVDEKDDNTFRIDFFESKSGFNFEVQGLTLGVVPYFKSIKINTKEYCKNPLVGYLDGVIQGYKPIAVSRSRKSDGNCGRRKVVHTELIVNGASTKAGDWPWHVALYKINHSEIKYICGGTLISNYYVLTAAHCASIRGNPIVPEALSVILGKYHLVGGDDGTQERQVHQIILHEEYNQRYSHNDIALLKLKSEVTFTDYVQPACLWYSHASEKLSSTSDILGTIVGWGFDNTDELSPHLRQAQLPIVPDATCIKSYPVFYSMVLDDNKFCAGFRNGVSACNGDSGSAFQIFIPDNEHRDNNTSLGAWYVRGVVSLTVSKEDRPICDPNYYGVYTDVAKYMKWIEDHTQ